MWRRQAPKVKKNKCRMSHNLKLPDSSDKYRTRNSLGKTMILFFLTSVQPFSSISQWTEVDWASEPWHECRRYFLRSTRPHYAMIRHTRRQPVYIGEFPTKSYSDLAVESTASVCKEISCITEDICFFTWTIIFYRLVLIIKIEKYTWHQQTKWNLSRGSYWHFCWCWRFCYLENAAPKNWWICLRATWAFRSLETV